MGWVNNGSNSSDWNWKHIFDKQAWKQTWLEQGKIIELSSSGMEYFPNGMAHRLG